MEGLLLRARDKGPSASWHWQRLDQAGSSIFSQQLSQWLWTWPQIWSHQLNSGVQAWQAWRPLRSLEPLTTEPTSHRRPQCLWAQPGQEDLPRPAPQAPARATGPRPCPESFSGLPNAWVASQLPLSGVASSCQPLHALAQGPGGKRAAACRMAGPPVSATLGMETFGSEQALPPRQGAPEARGHRGNQGLHPASSLLRVQGPETKPDETPSLKGDPWGVLGVGGHACWVS